MSDETYIKNPELEDFTEKHNGIPYTVKGMSIAKFPTEIAEHLKKHLANHIFEKRKLTNYPRDIGAIILEVEVDMEKAKELLLHKTQEQPAEDNGNNQITQNN